MKGVRRCFRVRDLRELVDDPKAATACRLRGHRWTFDGLIDQLRAQGDDLHALDLARLRAVAREVATTVGFDFRAALVADAAGNTVVRLAAKRPAKQSPTVFLPCAIMLEGLSSREGVVEDDDLDLLRAYAGLAIAAILERPASLGQGARLVITTSRLYLAGHLPDMALRLSAAGVEAIAAAAVTAPDAVAEFLVYALEAHYDSRVAVAEADPPIDGPSRVAIAGDMLKFLDESLAPAVEARTKVWERGPSASRTKETRRARAALGHRRMTWETSRAVAGGKWPPDRTEEWLALGEEYVALGDRGNAAGIGSVLIDELFAFVGRRPDQAAAFAAEFARAAEALESDLRLTEDVRPEHGRDLLKRLVRAQAACGQQAKARTTLDDAVASLAKDVRNAPNDYVRSALLQDADDWLGIDWEVEWPPGEAFRRTHAAVRRGTSAGIVGSAAAHVVRAFVSRTGSAFAVVRAGGETPEWVRAEESDELARTLVEFFRRTNRDVASFRAHNALPQTSADWTKLVARLSRQIGFNGLSKLKVPPPARWIVECDGTSIQLPLAGLAWLALRPEAVAVALPSGENAEGSEAPTAGDSLLALNGFPSNDPLHRNIDLLAANRGIAVTDFSTAAELQASLRKPARFVLLGCHGFEQRAARRRVSRPREGARACARRVQGAAASAARDDPLHHLLRRERLLHRRRRVGVDAQGPRGRRRPRGRRQPLARLVRERDVDRAAVACGSARCGVLVSRRMAVGCCPHRLHGRHAFRRKRSQAVERLVALVTPQRARRIVALLAKEATGASGVHIAPSDAQSVPIAWNADHVEESGRTACLPQYHSLHALPGVPPARLT